MAEQPEYLQQKKRVLHIAEKRAVAGGIGTVIDYLKEGVNSSPDFSADCLLTSYNQQKHMPEESTFSKGMEKGGKAVSDGELEKLIQGYDIVHIHGIPHYGILEKLQKIKDKSGTGLKIVNTAHSSVKQEFLAQLERAKDSDDTELKKDYKELQFYKDNNILDNPTKFGDTYWGSAIYRQERVMTMADSVQHMNNHYKNMIIKEYKAEENVDKHKVIPNGVKTIKEFTERPKKKRIMYIGRFAADKGIDELTEALPKIFEKHPDAEIKFVGGDESGKLAEQYKKKVEKLMREHFKDKPKHNIDKYLKQIHFTGWVKDKDELMKHYQWTDYVIIPSKAESFSLVASEALMHKRIPIMTKTPALDDLYISKGIALGIDPEARTAEGIAQTVNDILSKDKSKEYDELTNKGREFAIKNYSFENMVNMQLDSYRTLLGLSDKKVGTKAKSKKEPQTR